MKKAKAGAFTLIELLVVITVIAILAALLMPAFRAAMETSRTTKCASNLRQIAAGMFSFSNDHNNCFPESGGVIPWNATDTAGSGQQSWMQQIAPYVSSTDPKSLGAGGNIFTCPSSSMLTTAYPFDQYYSYFNGAHAAFAAHGGDAPVQKASISMPVEQILSGDITYWPFGATGVNDADKDDYSENPIQSQATFHDGKVNILFADGHVATAGWQPTTAFTAAPAQGYFDPTRMATHYPGVIDPKTNKYYTSYTDPDP